MATAAPFLASIEAARKLNGEPLITFQHGEKIAPQTERVAEYPWKVATAFAYGDPDPDAVNLAALFTFGDYVLYCTEIRFLRGNKQFVEVYRKWEPIPGPINTTREWGSGGQQVKVTEQITGSAAVLVGGEFVASETLAGITFQKNLRTVRTVLKPDGSAYAPGDLAAVTQEIRDGRLECTLYVDRFPVSPDAGSYTLPIEGTPWPATAPIGQVLEAKRHPVEGSPRDIAEITYLRALPSPRVEFPEIPFTFPGVFKQLQDWWNSANIPGPLHRPYIGKDLDIEVIRPKPLSNRGRRIYFYTYGPANDPQNLLPGQTRLVGNFFLPETYGVTSPAASSKVYRGYIEPNMIHPAFIAYYPDAVGDLVVTEEFPASTPATYDPREVLVARATSSKWEHGGRIYENIIDQVSEQTPPEFFAPIYLTVPLYATSAVEIARGGVLFGPDGFGFDAGVPLAFVSDGADTRTVRITGRNRIKVPPNEFPFHTEEITLNGTNIVTTATSWYKIFQLTLSAADAARTVGAYVGGIPASGSILADSASLADGDTLTLTHGSDVRVFTFYQPHRVVLQCDSKANIGAGAYLTIEDQYSAGSGKAVVFWFQTGADAAPAVGEREIMVDVATLTTAAEVADALTHAMVADLAGAAGVTAADGTRQFFVERNVDVVTINDCFLGTRAAASLVGGTFGGTWGFVGGDTGGAVAAAANQIRFIPDRELSGTGFYVTANRTNNTALAETLGAVATAIAAGACGPVTPALAYVADLGVSTPDEIDLTVQITDASDSAFTFATTSAGLTLVQPSGGGFSDFPLASFAPNATDAWIPIQFNDAALSQLDFPAKVTVTCSPVALGGRSGRFYLAAGPRSGETGYPAAPVSVTYEVSYDSVTWEASGESAISLTNGTPKSHAIPATHTYTTGANVGLLAVNYVRATFQNLANKNRAVFGYVSLLVS